MSKIIKEWRCQGHGEFTNATGRCPRGCPRSLVVREIRTAPRYERGNKKFIDAQMRGLMADHNLTDLRSDPKSGESALQTMAKSTDFKPRWIDVPHADPGFSARGEAAPKFDPASMGFTPSPEAGATLKKLPKPTPVIVGSYRE
jgi:hypothetical protein